MLSWLASKLRSSTVKAVEGQYRDGPWWTPHGIVLPSWGLNFWQRGYNPIAQAETSAMVEACVSAYAQTVAMCPGGHWRTNPNGGRERVTNSALSRILKKPNGYQSISDFLLNATRSLYVDGNAYALAVRNDRFEIAELHLMNPRSCAAQISEDGEIFYALGGNPIVDRIFADRLVVPARDVLHIRLHTPRSPMYGESPLAAAAADVAASGAMTAQQLAFFHNQSRPSGVLTTDQILTREQVLQLRESWEAQSRGLNTGGTPILTAGLKFQGMSASASDAQLAEVMKMTEQHIALAFRVPLPILGLGGTTFASTELLMQQWIASGLGFALNHIEEAFGILFQLRGQPEEYLELDTAALLRSAQKDRMDALVKGVQGGILSPNEARREEGFPSVEDGEEPRVQQQVVPLSWHKQQAELAATQAEAAAAAAAQPPEPANDADEPAEEDGPDERDYAALLATAARRYGG